MNEQEVQRKLDELKSDYNLTDEMLNKKCSEDHTFALEDILSEWKLVGRRLKGIKGKDIDDIDKDVKEGGKLKRQKLLELWHQRNGDDATYGDVVCALLLENCVEDATKVCKLISPQNGKYNLLCVRTDHSGHSIVNLPYLAEIQQN